MKLITIEQLAELISVKKKTIYDWTHRGAIPCVKVGKLLRFDPNEIERWIKSNSRKRSNHH